MPRCAFNSRQYTISLGHYHTGRCLQPRLFGAFMLLPAEHSISCLGLQAFADAVDVGRIGVELAALMEHAIMLKGTGVGAAVRVRGYAQVAAGAKECAVAYRPNEISTTCGSKTRRPRPARTRRGC